MIEASSPLPLEYSIDNGVTYIQNPDFQNLAAGEYHVWVRNNECLLDAGTKTVGSPPQVAIAGISFSDQGLCSGDESGFIEITGTGPSELSYSINGGLSFSEDNRFINLPPDTYTLVVKSGSCISEESVVEIISIPNPETPSLTVTNHNTLE